MIRIACCDIRSMKKGERKPCSKGGVTLVLLMLGVVMSGVGGVVTVDIRVVISHYVNVYVVLRMVSYEKIGENSALPSTV
jgi:hypothetical protein